MHARHPVQLAFTAVVCVALAGAAMAQATKTPPQPPANWNQTVTKESDVAGQEFDAKQIDLIQKVSAYFNQLGDMKGNFVQTSADNKRLRGKFYLKRPGQFRFEYNLPSKQIMISDGKYLSIQDLDLKNGRPLGHRSDALPGVAAQGRRFAARCQNPGGRRGRRQDCS